MHFAKRYRHQWPDSGKGEKEGDAGALRANPAFTEVTNKERTGCCEDGAA
jgi:hypothetical protein